MTTFDDRARAFETKFAYDNEMAFKIAARSRKSFGLWAAENLGKSGLMAEAYAHELVMQALENGSESLLLEKVMEDLRVAGSPLSEKEARKMLAECIKQAREQLH